MKYEIIFSDVINIKPETYTDSRGEFTEIFNKSEFAGATFSPDGKVMFVNIYKPAMTFAIEGPWDKI